MADTVETAIYRLRVEGQEQLDKLKTSLDGVAISEEKVSNETRTTSQALQNRLSRMDPLIRAQEQYRKELESAARYAEAGLGTNAQRAAQIELATRRYNEQVAAIKGLSEAHVGLNAQGQALFHSIRSVGEQLALGVSPVQALTGQINHLSFAASGQGGLSSAFSQVAGMARTLINPITLTIGAVAGLAAGAAAAAVQFDRLQVSSQRALGGAGKATGTTVSDLNKFTSQNSAIIGTGLSNKEARALGEDFTRTGEIVISRLHGMSDAVVGFSNQTGKSMEDARKAMVEFALDPKKALEELSKVYGAFDEQTRRAVETLTIAGDKTGAFQAIIDSLGEKSRKAADNMGLLEKAGAAVVNFLAGASSKPSGIESQIEEAKSRLNAAIEGASGLGIDDARIAAASQSIEKLSRELEKLQAIEQRDMSDKLAAGLNNISAEADGATRAITPQIDQLQKLEAQLAKLERARDSGSASKYGADADNAAALAVANQINALRDAQAEAVRYNQNVAQISLAWSGVSQSTAMALQQQQNMLPVIQAVTGAQQMAAQYAADYANALMMGKAQADALAIAAMNLEKSQAAATANVLKQVEALKDQNAMLRAAQNGTEASTAAAIAYKNAMASGADETAAAALKAETLKNQILQAASGAGNLANNLKAINGITLSIAGAASLNQREGTIIDDPHPDNPGWTASFHQQHGPQGTFTFIDTNAQAGVEMVKQLNALTANGGLETINKILSSGGGIDKAISSLMDIRTTDLTWGPSFDREGQTASGADPMQVFQNLQALYALKNEMAPDNATKAANLQEELAWLEKQPASLAQMQAVVSLRKSIEELQKSTDDLNKTNQALLSPYYDQDPRKTHIGFRSQGMATGGWVDVPGVPSANDNMIAQIPVAGGERIYVDPNPSRRGGGSSASSVHVTNQITISGSADKNEIGRTFYQLGQMQARQIAAAR